MRRQAWSLAIDANRDGVDMKTQVDRIEDLRHSRFEADLEARINALFFRCPTLSGFSVRDAANRSRDRLAPEHVSELFVTDVSVYPLTGLEASGALCNEIVAVLVELIDECPVASELLRERTFARVFHQAVVEKLYGALRKALANEGVRARYRSMGVEVMDMSQAEFVAYVRADLDKWRTIAREGNIVIE